jgi:precorrin-6B methylase 1
MNAHHYQIETSADVLDQLQDDLFTSEISSGWIALEQLNLREAEARFIRAHALGHADTLKHLRSHQGLFVVFWRRRNLHEVAKHLASIAILASIYVSTRLFKSCGFIQ